MHTPLTCRICGHSDQHPQYVARETHHYTGVPFRYFSCLDCGTLQIIEIPSNLGDYYSSDYYSFTVIRDRLKTGGIAQISMPMAQCYSWRTFCQNWFGWDPPRHLHILSAQSVTRLAASHGLEVVGWEPEDSEEILELSHTISLTVPGQRPSSDVSKITAERDYRKLSRDLKAQADSDTATFFLRKSRG